jgi:hypothetical protein
MTYGSTYILYMFGVRAGAVLFSFYTRAAHFSKTPCCRCHQAGHRSRLVGIIGDVLSEADTANLMTCSVMMKIRGREKGKKVEKSTGRCCLNSHLLQLDRTTADPITKYFNKEKSLRVPPIEHSTADPRGINVGPRHKRRTNLEAPKVTDGLKLRVCATCCCC